MQNTTIIQELRSLVQEKFLSQSADHDWYHIVRVYQLACYIHQFEGGDLEVIQAGALLHDISDHKLNGGVLNDNGRVAKALLLSIHAPSTLIDAVVNLVDKVSYKGAAVQDEVGSLELSIVRDADRLDAMGAIGIARAFHYGGARNRPFFVPNEVPVKHASFEAYSTDQSHTINHFHEKLLLLNERLITKTAKRIGSHRHALMQSFVDEFMLEWDVNLNDSIH
jgi:uncharacterized protein